MGNSPSGERVLHCLLIMKQKSKLPISVLCKSLMCLLNKKRVLKGKNEAIYLWRHLVGVDVNRADDDVRDFGVLEIGAR